MSLYVDIEKHLGSFLLKVKFEAGNETVSLLGASGCGKSMTLKCIAGIEKPDKGQIVLDGNVLFDSEKGINLPPQKRHVGLMFQNYALFPGMTVLGNIKAGAKREKDRAKRRENIEKVLAAFHLSELSSRYPHQLSGGQQQRTALARMLVSAPDILLLDEPFSALDSHLRFHLEEEMRKTIHAFGKTVVLVSHDRDEVYRLSDKIAVMQNGRIEAFGDKKSVFSKPVTRNGAVLTGCKNISPMEKRTNNSVYAYDWGMELKVDNIPENAEYIGIRMHGIRPGKGENSFICRVTEVIENPFSYTIMLRPSGRDDVSSIGWETDKSTWEALRSDELEISLPREALLMLSGN